MAINSINTVREAKVVSEELDRMLTNMTMLLMMMSMDPEFRSQVALTARFLKGMAVFSDDLKMACKGLTDTDEVFSTPEMDMKEVEGIAALKQMFGDRTK